MREINEYKEKAREYKKNNQTIGTKAATPNLAIAPLSTTVTNVYIPGASTVNCPSRTPCYGQFSDTYGTTICTLGCSPNAMAIIYGYYDRQGTKPNLVTGVATDISYVKNASGTVIHPLDANIRTMSNSIRTSMGTQCYSGLGGTLQSNVPLGIAYAKSKGYTSSTATYVSSNINPANILQALRVEVNAGRPMIIHSNGINSGHPFVAYGYSSDTTSTMVRVNYGGSYLGDKSYFGRDINLAQAVPAVVGGGTFNAYTKISISN